MNKFILLLISAVFIFINDWKLLYQISILILVLIGVYYFFKQKKFGLKSIEKYVLYSFAAYSFSYLIYILNDIAFTFRDIDHGSRFFLLIPLYFVFRDLKSFKFLDNLILFSTLFTSTVVIINFFILDKHRAYNNSCISGAQVSLIFGILTLFISLKKNNLSRTIIFITASIFAFIAVVLSQTRGVILCVPILIILVIYLRYERINLKTLSLISLILTSLIFLGLQFIPELKSRFNYTKNNVEILLDSIEENQFHGSTSITIRYNFQKYGFLAFLESPLWGSGRKGFRDEMTHSGFNKNFLPHATHSHNQFISDLVMRGLFGFLSTVIFMSYLIYTFVRLRRKGDYEFASYGLILVCSYILFFLTDSPFIGSMHSTLFFIFCSLLFLSASFNEVEKKE